MKKIDRKGIIEFLVGLLFLIIPQIVFAQQTVVKGKITNASNGDPVPFANVYFKGTTIGTVTDFDGYFQVSTEKPLDTLVVSYMGYITKEKNIERGVVQTLNIQLEEDVVNLEEVVFVAEENPAFAIMRNVIKNKKSNDLRSLDSYEYESYTKIEVDVDNISDKFKEKKIVKKITAVIDSIEQIAGEDGQPVLPMLFSEAISRYYYKKNPTFRHEEIIKTKISGVGITDGTLTSQIIGSSFQQYNFYQN
ncbi:MAG: DUF5686 and carboxypeptidase regulatory-like domain-containing protein, partial [Cyclobacteriaceae bacterium]|nr:DUF5686 and carboxypeptidase regulatory-like domain-containing protein [Cyclobacteriaceae bacterium]